MDLPISERTAIRRIRSGQSREPLNHADEETLRGEKATESGRYQQTVEERRKTAHTLYKLS